MRKPSRKKAAALQYAHGEDRAPRLVAKGQGAIAEKIIAVAREHGIPVRDDKAMVEVLASLDLYQEIPPALYRAVAEILVFIYRLNNTSGKAAPLGK